MTDSEKIDLLLSEMLGMKSDMQGMRSVMQDLKSDVQNLKSDMQGVKSDVQNLKSDMQSVNNRIDNLGSQMKQSERVLKSEIRKECSMLFNEIERVHDILNKHVNDTTKHTT